MTLSRRRFLSSVVAATGASGLAPSLVSSLAFGAEGKGKKILLRSSWQTVNIGDIAHTPGVLALLEKYLPEAEVQLWPSSVDHGVEELLRARFPKLVILKGADAVKKGIAECDFFLHGSGASLVAQRDLERWVTETGKPYGIFGITLPLIRSSETTPTSDASMTKTIEMLSGAKFVYFRDSVSLGLAKEKGAKAPIMEFGPDGAFGVDLRNDEPAKAFLKANGLEEGQFLCCIPRLRYSPYWKMKEGAKFDEVKNRRNEEMKEHDHAPLREAIIAVVRGTKMKVLVCPEDSSQMEIGKQMLVDPLPADVKERVVWREKYWLTDEAVSTYVRSAGLFGNEMHSPIMCIGNGIPAIVCRFKEQTSKGLMWKDIGLGDWLFDLDDEAQVKQVAPTVLAMAKDPAGSKARAAKAQAFARERQKAMCEALAAALKA